MQMRRRIKPASVFVTLFLVAAAGLLSVYLYKSRPYHFLEVAKGVIYRSGTLKPHHLEAVVTAYGIRTVVNLRPVDPRRPPQWYRDETEVCRKLGIALIDMPMKPETPPSDEQLEKWLSILSDPKRLPVLVHCKHGAVRTGMMVAVFEVAFQNKDNASVLENLPMFGHSLWSDRRRPMREFVLKYRPRQAHGDPATSRTGAAPG